VTHLLFIVALLGYFAATVLYLMLLSLRRPQLTKFARAAFFGAFAAHTAGVFWYCAIEQMGSVESRQDVMFWLAWLLPLGFVLARRRLDFEIPAAFTSGAALLFLSSSSWLAHGSAGKGDGSSLYVVIAHAIPAVLAQVSLIAAFILSATFLLQAKRLKRKAIDTLALKSPSLEMLEQLTSQSVLAGFLCMGLAVVTGSLWALSRGELLMKGDPYQWLGVLAWLTLAFIMQVRNAWHLSGRRFARVVAWSSGTFVLAFSFVTFWGGALFHGSYAAPLH
jgi:ABC-type uncharacterized transport system permease subunit